MAFFIFVLSGFNLVLSGSLVWLIGHYWLRLPGEGNDERLRAVMMSFIKGAAIPVGIWVVLNLGLLQSLPPLLPSLDNAQQAGRLGVWIALRYLMPATTLIVSFWAGFALLLLALAVRQRTDKPDEFKHTAIVWSLIMSPVCGLLLLVGGLESVGIALVAWLTPIVHLTLPGMVIPKRPPSYSLAIGKLKFGKYADAEVAIIRELERVENDFNGWMMLAELYAVHFNDFEQAEQTVIELCEQPETEPSNACVALHRLADWYLELRMDPEGARRCMEAISVRYPNTHLDKMARLRLRRLPKDRDELEDSKRAKPLHLPALHDDLEPLPTLTEAEHDAATTAAERYSSRLSAHPEDTANREAFARSLAKLGKLDTAIEQVDLMLSMDGQSTEARAEWMGLKAAWMTHLQGDCPAVRALLQELIDEYPDSTQAFGAKRRLLLFDEQARTIRHAAAKKKPRIVIRPDDPPAGTDPAAG